MIVDGDGYQGGLISSLVAFPKNRRNLIPLSVRVPVRLKFPVASMHTCGDILHYIPSVFFNEDTQAIIFAGLCVVGAWVVFMWLIKVWVKCVWWTQALLRLASTLSLSPGFPHCSLASECIRLGAGAVSQLEEGRDEGVRSQAAGHHEGVGGTSPWALKELCDVT